MHRDPSAAGAAAVAERMGTASVADFGRDGRTHYLSAARIVASHSASIHSVALAADGRLFAWGCGSDGRTGLRAFMGGGGGNGNASGSSGNGSSSGISGSASRGGSSGSGNGGGGAKRRLKCYISTPSAIESLHAAGRRVVAAAVGRYWTLAIVEPAGVAAGAAVPIALSSLSAAAAASSASAPVAASAASTGSTASPLSSRAQPPIFEAAAASKLPHVAAAAGSDDEDECSFDSDSHSVSRARRDSDFDSDSDYDDDDQRPPGADMDSLNLGLAALNDDGEDEDENGKRGARGMPFNLAALPLRPRMGGNKQGT